MEKKRIPPSKIKSRIEFFSSVVTKILKENDESVVTYKTKLFPYDVLDARLLPDEIDLESTSEGTTILEGGTTIFIIKKICRMEICKKK